MPVITPQSDLYLLHVPLEVDEENQLTFANKTAQFNYFNSMEKIEADNYTYQRKDGTIRYGGNFDDVIKYNYVMYRNEAYSDKWFYAFITGMEYLNDNVTAISIKTDVWQTWQFDLNYKRTFVEREHVNDDTIGIHTVPENLELGDYQIVDLQYASMWEDAEPSQDFLVVFCVTELPKGGSVTLTNPQENGRVAGDLGYIGGVFSSLIFFAVENFNQAENIIDAYNNAADVTADAIVNIYTVPRCCVNFTIPYADLTKVSRDEKIAVLHPLFNYYQSDSFKIQQSGVLANNYVPVNNKLFTYPYSYLFVTNNVGEAVEMRYEDFPFENIAGNNARTISYTKYLVPSASVSGKLLFDSYKNYTSSVDYPTKINAYGINYGKIPVCAWTTDYYTNWLTQNGVNVGLSIASSILTTGIGLATGGATLAGAALNGGLQIANTLSEVHRAATTPPQAHGDINTGDYTFAFSRNIISFYKMSVRPEMAQIIDNYFSAYGYKVNSIKLPNITGRRNWNYVKTIGCYIEAQIPQDDLQEIKNMFNNGITLWHNPATFADYSQNNDII